MVCPITQGDHNKLEGQQHSCSTEHLLEFVVYSCVDSLISGDSYQCVVHTNRRRIGASQQHFQQALSDVSTTDLTRRLHRHTYYVYAYYVGVAKIFDWRILPYFVHCQSTTAYNFLSQLLRFICTLLTAMLSKLSSISCVSVRYPYPILHKNICGLGSQKPQNSVVAALSAWADDD